MSFESHQISNKLYDYEKKRLIDKANCDNFLILSSAITELWLSDKPHHSSWSKIGSGILCLVQKKDIKCDFFQQFDLNGNLLWEQEVYVPFKYECITKNFHYFPAKDRNVGFNFAFIDEAEQVLQFVNKNLRGLNRGNKASNFDTLSIDVSTEKKSEINNFTNNYSSQKYESKNTLTQTKQKTKDNKLNSIITNQKERARRLFNFKRQDTKIHKDKSKLEISSPNNFQVLQQVKINGDSININTKDDITKEKMMKILSELNMKPNKKNEKFVENFIKKIENESIKDENNFSFQNVQRVSASEKITHSIIYSDDSSVKQAADISKITSQTFIFQNCNTDNQSRSSDSQTSIDNCYKVESKIDTVKENARVNFDEASMIDMLKNELGKRALYLNNSDSEEFETTEETDNEWN